MNQKIKSDKLRVISDDGDNLGVISKEEALKVADQKEMDLVLIGPNADPPVAKILNFSKFLYEEKKKKTGYKGKKSELKELRFGPTTGDGDIKRHINRATEFIREGNRVKISVIMRGREAMYPQLAFEKLNRIISELSEVSKLEAQPKHQGNSIFVIFVPK